MKVMLIQLFTTLQIKFMIIASELYWALWGISVHTSFNVDLDVYTQNKMRFVIMHSNYKSVMNLL